MSVATRQDKGMWIKRTLIGKEDRYMDDYMNWMVVDLSHWSVICHIIEVYFHESNCKYIEWCERIIKKKRLKE